VSLATENCWKVRPVRGFFFGEWHIAEEAEDAGQGVGLEALAKLLSIPLVEGAGVLSLGSQTNMWMRARTSHL